LPEFIDVPALIEPLVPVVPTLPEAFMLPEAVPELSVVLMLPLVPVVELLPFDPVDNEVVLSVLVPEVPAVCDAVVPVL